MKAKNDADIGATRGCNPAPVRKANGSDIAGTPAKEGEQMRVPIELLDGNPDQPRQYVDPDYIEELAETILQRGLIHRIVVRRMGTRFQIVAGHCRRAAFKLLA